MVKKCSQKNTRYFLQLTLTIVKPLYPYGTGRCPGKMRPDVQSRSINILSDSKSIITHLYATSKTLNPLVNGEVREIIDWIDEIASLGCKITITWIPGHSDIPGNMRADELANSACQSTNTMMSQVQFSTTKNWSRRRTQSLFGEFLRDNTPNSKSNLNAASRVRFRKILSNPPPNRYGNRRAEISLFRVLVGHCNIGAHWFRRRRKNVNFMCRRCGYHLETAEHLLFKCSLLPFKDPLLADKLLRSREECDNFRQFLDLLNHQKEKYLIDRIIELQSYGVVL